jgi:hypothetical protein
MRRKIIIGMIVITAIVAAVMFTGCVEKESPDDIKFKSWCHEQSKKLDSDAQMLEDLSANNDLKALGKYSARFYDNITIALEEIDQFDVSPEMQPAKKDFKLVLEECKNATYYMEQGARNSDSVDLRKGNEYLDYATEHLDVMYLLNET